MTSVTVLTSKATGYARWQRTVETKERRALRRLLGLRIGQIADALPIPGFPKAVLTAAWREHLAAMFIEGRSTTTLNDTNLHRYILAIEAWASEKGVTFPDPPEGSHV